MGDFERFKQEIQSEQRFVIYGAQHHAQCMNIAFKILLPDAAVLCFMVSDKRNNPDKIDGIEVRSVQDGMVDLSTPVLIAASEKYFAEIYDTLTSRGFSNVFNGTFGSDFDNDVRELYFRNCFIGGTSIFRTLSQVNPQCGGKKESICMYMARCIVDRELQSEISTPEYVRPVQAGAALTEKVIADLRDDMGENISHKNRNYCECTVTHYIWKNATEDYVGLCHYRRRFQWDQTDLKILESGAVDVVLPYPVITVRDKYDIHYKPYVEESVYQVMLDVLEQNYREYYTTALEVMQGDMFYPCNLVLAKKRIFDAYAEWMFDVLRKVEAVCGDENVRTDRYLGYLAEHLTTFYFVKNRMNMNIVHSRMEILK